MCVVTNRECVDDFTIDLEDREPDEFTDKAGLCSVKATYIHIHMFEPAPVVLYIHNCKRQCFFPNIYIRILNRMALNFRPSLLKSTAVLSDNSV